MKRILAIAAILALAIPAVAQAREGRDRSGDQQQNAQQGDQNRGGDGQRGGGRGQGQGQGQGRGQGRGPQPQATTPPSPPPNQGNQQGNQNFRRGGGNPGGNQSGPAFARPQGSVNARQNQNNNNNNNFRRFDNDNNRRGGNDNRFGNNNNNRFDNNNRRFDNNDRNRFAGRNFGYERFSGRNFRFRGRAFTAVHAPRFIYPRGYSYRRWSIGALLPSLFLGDEYYVDYFYLGLPPPGYGEEWVRYGPDALLVDTYSGEVIDVAYGVFY